MAPNTRDQTHKQQQASDQLDQPNQAAGTPVTMEALAALMADMKTTMNTMNTRLESLEARSRPSTPAPQQLSSPPHSNQGTQSTAQPIIVQSAQSAEDKRWRPEEIGSFDGTGDVYAFTDRLASIAELKTPKLIQINLVTLLKGTAFNWYHYELVDDAKWALNASASIDPWCQALIRRFGPSHSDLISQLESSRYTRKDAANRRDATAYIQDVMRLAKGLKWTQQDGLMTAYHHFEPSLQQTLDQPTNLNSFIQQVQLRQQGWFQIYATYGTKPPPPRPPQQPQPYRPPYRPSAPPGPPPQPRAYWAAGDEEEEDYIYDAPSDAYIAAPGYGPHPGGHTPRRWGNTHDGQRGAEAEANWASAGADHRCTHQGCTHYH